MDDQPCLFPDYCFCPICRVMVPRYGPPPPPAPPVPIDWDLIAEVDRVLEDW